MAMMFDTFCRWFAGSCGFFFAGHVPVLPWGWIGLPVGPAAAATTVFAALQLVPNAESIIVHNNVIVVENSRKLSVTR